MAGKDNKKEQKVFHADRPRRRKVLKNNPTTNAAPDPHLVFCRRCQMHNKGCPIGTYKCSL